MLLIADAGSTKTDWKIIENSKTISAIQTIGFNPVLVSSKLIINELKKSFDNSNFNHQVKSIYYYGAGCWNESTCSIVEKALKIIFPQAAIFVTNDLLGAAKSVCGNEAGVACILGTGANSCLYDGEKIIDNIPALGYIMGDEGSGAYLGKKLLQSYFYRSLPLALKEKLEKQYAISKQILLEKVYQNKGGNQYLATFAQFIIEEKKHPYLEQLIGDAFDTFIKSQLLKYPNIHNLPIHFIGSIAFFLKEILEKRLQENGLTLGKIIRQPIDGLVDYHIKHQYSNK